MKKCRWSSLLVKYGDQIKISTREAQIWRASGIWQIDISRSISEIFFAKYSESEDLGRGLETWKIQNVGGRGHRVERYGGPNAWKQRSSWKNQGKEMCSFSKRRSGGKIVAINIGRGFWRPISLTQLKVNFCRKYLSLESTASRFLYGTLQSL